MQCQLRIVARLSELPIISEVCLKPTLADLFDVSPDVGLRSVDICETVFQCELTRADRLFVPSGALRITCNRDDSTTDVSRRLRKSEVSWGCRPVMVPSRPYGVAPILLGNTKVFQHHL